MFKLTTLMATGVLAGKPMNLMDPVLRPPCKDPPATPTVKEPTPAAAEAMRVLSQEAEQQNPNMGWWGTFTNSVGKAADILTGTGTIADKRDQLGNLFNTTQTQIAKDVEKAEKEAEKKEAEAEKEAQKDKDKAKKDTAKVEKDAEKAEKDAEKAAKEAAEGAEDTVDGKKGAAERNLAKAKENADTAIKNAQKGANTAINNAKNAIDEFKHSHGIKHKARHMRKQQKTLRQEPDAEVKAELAEHPIAEMDADVAELPTEAEVAVENTAVETTHKHKKKHEKVKAHAHSASKEPVVEKSEEAPAQADEFDAPTVELIDTAHVETGNAATATAALAMVVGFAAL